MINSVIINSSREIPIEFCLYLDNDYLHNLPLLPKHEFVTYIKLFGPSLPISTMTNVMYSQSSGEIIMYCADDVVFRTPRWDKRVTNELPNPTKEIQMLGPSDGSRNFPKIITHGFVTRKMAKTLGYLLPPFFGAEYGDTWLTEIARKSNCLSIAGDLLIEHMHPNWGKAPSDSLYEARDRDRRSFEDFILYKMMWKRRKREIELLMNTNKL